MQPAADLDISKTPAVRNLHPLTVIPLTHQIEDDGDEIDLFSWLFCGFLALLPFAVLAFLVGLFD